MSPRRPYLLRALIEWIIDNNQTPYVLVEAGEGVQVPSGYVNDGRIVLNVSAVAIRNLSITNQFVMFDGRFGGQSFPVSVPLHAVIAVYSKESGEGELFAPEYQDRSNQERVREQPADAELPAGVVSDPSGGPARVKTPPKSRAHLRPVK